MHVQNHDFNHSRVFAVGIFLNISYVAVEFFIGLWIGSLGLLADAGHNLGDVFGLLIAWFAHFMTKRQPTRYRTYGFKRSSILAAMFNGFMILFVAGAIAWEAIRRLLSPQPVQGLVIIVVAAAGVVINSLTAYLLHSSGKNDLNIRGAFLHMFADASLSLGVVLGGVMIYFTDWLWIDPLVSLMVVLVIILSSWDLFKKSLNLALDAVPPNIDPLSIRNYLSDLPGITDVHHLHIWAMSTTETAMTVHLIKPDGRTDDQMLRDISDNLRNQFKIDHVTIQLENGATDDKFCFDPGMMI